MADASRQEKLNAARRKLQKFQQKRTPSSKNSTPSGVKTSNSSKRNKSAANTGKNNSEVILDTPTGVYKNQQVSTVKPLSSTESLKQLSRQLNGLMSESPLVNGATDYTNASMKELEVRNQELAAEVDQQVQSNRNVLIQIEEYKKQCRGLQEQLEKERKHFEQRIFKEQSSLKEQLQVHIQTIGILVSEKTELQGLASHARTNLKQKSEEADNLSSRLQASRQRVADLERNLVSVNSSSNQLQKKSKNIDKRRESLQEEVFKLRKTKDELEQHSSELTSQVRTKVLEYKELQDSLTRLKETLNMSELRVQQLTAQNNLDSTGALQTLQEDKVEVEIKLAEYAQAVQQLTTEREYLAKQYEDNMHQLQEYSQKLANQINLLTLENNRLLEQEKRLTEKIEILQNAKGEEQTVPTADPELIKELQERLAQVEEEKNNVKEQYNAQVNDNMQLGKLYQDKEQKVEELESVVFRFKDDSTDRTALLESIQNDKATISRAVAQNRDLKSQLEEFQDAFVKMSENNMNLTSSIQTEQHTTNLLNHQVEETTVELEEVKRQVEGKDVELEDLRRELTQMQKELLQNAQMADRAQHYAANQPVIDTLQREFADAQENVRALSEENTILKSRIVTLEEDRPDGGMSLNDSGEVSHSESHGDMIAELSAVIRQLEADRDQMRLSFIEQEAQKRVLQQEASNHSQDEQESFPLERKSVSQEALETLQLAMEKLQTRFGQIMREKVDLLERCQELEHVNLQLTGETETIGEYITLYHNQRHLLKRRQAERERYVAMLATEKDRMQEKLNQLQNLVMQLLQEKKQLHPYEMTPDHLMTPTFEDSPNAFKVKDEHQMNNIHSINSEGHSDDDVGEDWPSSSGDSEGSIDEATMATDQFHTANSMHDTYSEHIPNTEHTAHQIIQLLQQMSGSNDVDRGTILDRDFLPCKCCTGTMIDV